MQTKNLVNNMSQQLMHVTKITLLSLSIFLTACFGSSGSSSNSANTQATNLSLNFAPIPQELTLNQTQTRFASNIKYGDDQQQAFDILLPDVAFPTPVVIYIHGGSFNAGDKSNAYKSTLSYGNTDTLSGTLQQQINTYLDHDVAFASINYRLLERGEGAIDSQGVIKPLSDIQRCVQFIRYHAQTLNIDPERMVLHGISAGAGGALWLAFQDDLSIEDSPDPIARESTRVSAVVAQETQATYDLISWIAGGVFNDYFGLLGILFTEPIVNGIVTLLPSLGQQLLSFFSITDIAEIFSPEIQAYRERIDILNYISADDPEIWVSNIEELAVFPTNQSLFFHHPHHARLLKQTMQSRQAIGKFYIPQIGDQDPSGERLSDFVLRKLGVSL